MPFKPPTHKLTLPDGVTAHARAVEDNARRQADPSQVAAAAIYASPRWKRLRRLHLTHHPLCVACLATNRTTPATDVDHVKPIRQGGNPYDAANLQSLCHACHASKTRGEATRGE